MTIELVQVSKDYKTTGRQIRAIDNLSMTVNKGERVGILGKNGSGKSTLISLIGGVELPTAGRINRNMSVSWPLAFRGGFQPNLSGYANIRFLAQIYQKPYEELAAKVEDFSELGERLEDPIATYSSGMRAKFSFGASLAIEFDCYLIDEIVAVGDRRFRRKCREALEETRADRALLMASHQAHTIRQYCSVGILLENGRYVDRFDISADKGWEKHLITN